MFFLTNYIDHCLVKSEINLPAKVFSCAQSDDFAKREDQLV